jgi:hypothetical protein
LGLTSVVTRGFVGSLARDISCILGGLSNLRRCLLRRATSPFRSPAHSAFGRLPHRISNSLGCLARTLGGMACALASLPSRLASTFADGSGGLSCTLTGFLGSLAGTFAHFSGSLARPLAYVSGGLSCAFTHLLGGLTGALTNIFHRRLGT